MSASHFDAAQHPRSGATGQFVLAPRAETGVTLTEQEPATPAVFTDGAQMPTRQLLEELYTHARALMDAHGLHDWRLGYTKHRGITLGTTRHAGRTITLSAAHMVTVSGPERLDTVLHEIAHALLPAGEGHGWRWQDKAREVGATPQRCADTGGALAASAAVVGTCPMGHTYSRARMPARGARSFCTKPGHPVGQPREERELTWTRNAVDPDVAAMVAKYPAEAKADPLPVGARVRLSVSGHELDGALGTVLRNGRTNAVVRVDGQLVPYRLPFTTIELAS